MNVYRKKRVILGKTAIHPLLVSNLTLTSFLQRTGLPPIIPFPLPPPGFVVPPAGVPNPKTPCKEDYTKTSCKDCKALEGWCTVGDNAGCPCKEECPADDKKPKCSDDGCKGDDKGACTIVCYLYTLCFAGQITHMR